MQAQQLDANQARIQQLEEFINEVLKEELKQLEQCLNKYNEEIMEYVQLKNTLQALGDHFPDGYKTQVNIGSNIFMEAHVSEADKVLVNIGSNIFLEMSAVEAEKLCDMRIKVLTKQADVLREESVKKRAQVKMALIAISERQNLVQAADQETK
ncbi:protein UXT homolog [Scaptodrosophila lebanonensis]|uniref:Protein UXT homolog n=1 Tax=Drosophila lebanonensis TaxID=7225 RepID=A0A6J2U7Y5_DROLE|nr:protein UXT homolog [Scaptodrosophila lebanonensis]